MTANSFDDHCRRIIEELGLGSPADINSITPLSGGVASDIAVVDVAGRKFCVKMALARLKVATVWEAPVRRNEAEYRWLEFAGRVRPDAAPALYGRSARHNGFAMAYLAPDACYLWKTALLAGETPKGEAAAVAETLGAIHDASTQPAFDPARFANRDDFQALRLDPYLEFTARAHPDLAGRLRALARDLFARSTALVHGDVSPKNILMRPQGPVLLDAECATMGDPAFDVAFCLNHLVLKSLHLPARSAAYLGEAHRFWTAYAPAIRWEPAADLERRAAALLPALMLARIDGKSPVEYLSAANRTKVRALSRDLLEAEIPTLPQTFQFIADRSGDRHAD